MRKFSFIAVFLLMFSICALSQNNFPTVVRPYVGGAIGSSTMGYQSPLVDGFLGVQVEGPRVLLFADVAGGLARKAVDPFDGEHVSFSGTALLRYKLLVAGGGFEYKKQFTSTWTKSAYNPSATIGIDHYQDQFLTSLSFPGNDKLNGSRSLTFHNEFKFSTHWRWTHTFSYSWFHETDYPGRTVPLEKFTGKTFYTGIVYVFGKPYDY